MYHYDYRLRGWYWGDYEIKGHDSLTFTPHNSQWATDKNGLFNQSKRVRVKDPASIQVLNHHFAKDSQQVYYIMGVAKAVLDVASFEVLPEPEHEGESRQCYARDRFSVYYADLMSGTPKVLKKADRNTFHIIGDGRGKDQQHVWYGDSLMKGAAPSTFEIIDHLYAKDGRRVYYAEAQLADSDPITFRIIGHATGADKSNVYHFRERILGADPATFEVLDSHYGKDANNVYFGASQLPHADPATFRVIGWSTGVDKSHVFLSANIVEGADPLTYTPKNPL